MYYNILKKISMLCAALWWAMASLGLQSVQAEEIRANKLLMMKSVDKDRKLIFSDSPEYIDKDGILYTDIISGKGRLFYYHLPSVHQSKKIIVLLENMSKKPVNFKIERYGSGGASNDYFKVGKETAQSYYYSKKPQNKIIPPHGTIVLNKEDYNRKMDYDQLVENMVDFTTNGSVKITVLVMPFEADPKTFYATAQVLPRDEHNLRGTYDKADRYLKNWVTYNPSKENAAYFYLADNKIDKYQWGVDATDNAPTLNYGNYGINYHIKIKTKGKGRTKVYLQPMGGGFAGAVNVINKDGTSRVVSVPRDQRLIGNSDKPEYALLGTFKDKDGFQFEFNSPGGSFLPVKIILVPEQQSFFR